MTVVAALLWTNLRKSDGRRPSAVPMSAWFTALCATMRMFSGSSGLSERTASHTIPARAQSSRTG